LTVSPAATVVQAGNTATVTGMTPNTLYTFSVVVTGTNGVASAATIANAATNALPATALLVTGVTDVAANVSWTSPVGGGNALMTAKPTSGVGAVVTSTASGVVTGLTPSTAYTFSVVITGSNGVPSAAITTTATTAQTPAILNAATIGKAVLLSANTLALSWTDKSIGETGYQVQVSQNNGLTWTTIPAAQVAGSLTGVGTGATITATVTTTMNRALYQFRVLPVAGLATGPVSLSVSIDLRIRPTSVALTSVTSPVGSGKVVLVWTATSNNTATVTVQRRVRTGRRFSGWTNVATLAGNATGFTDASVTVGSNYQYRVVASNVSANTVGTNSITVVAR
jgi:hypothetical protein